MGVITPMGTLRSNKKREIFAGVVLDQNQELIRALINFLRPDGEVYSVKIMRNRKYTSYEVGSRRTNTRRDPDSRAQLAKRFKTTYAALGLSLDDVAKLLHVTPRTVHNWNSGRYDIPYAAVKLLRVLLRYELPHDQWRGWHFSGGKLYTPEGHSIAPQDSDWWSLLVLRAKSFSVMYDKCRALERQLKATGTTATGDRVSAAHEAPGGAVSGLDPQDQGRRAAPGLNLLLEHFRTVKNKNGANPPSVAITFEVDSANSSHYEKGVRK